ncbi:MAG: hypothetical protein FD181_1983 [Prolixibacteraceae bacterium]|nr:MAG: hypothetical protein FD181_1983 [Prolixibacteraceae bacterium]
MKRSVILVLAFLFATVVYSQDEKSLLKLGLTGGFGGYSYENLSDINEAVINQLPFDAAVIDNFPDRFYFGGVALIRIANWYWAGPSYQFHSTGSRVGAKDYSGSYHFDQILSAHQLGLENEIRISKTMKPAIFLDISGGVNFPTWKTEEVLEISGETNEDRSEYVAVKPFVLPAFKVSYPVYKNFSVTAQAGYLFDLGGKYHLSGNKDYQSTLKIPWSGYRFSLGLEYNVIW